jgi:hypothetical protein
VYAVAFFTPGSAPFQCVDMSYILLRFMDKYIRSGNYNRFNLVSLSYKLGPSGTFGVLLFDERLRTAYHQARVRARASQNSFRRQYDHPISTWPSNSIFLKGADVVAQLMSNARFVFPQIKFNFSQICPDSDFLLHCKDPPILYLIRSRTPTPSPQLVSPLHCYHLFHLLNVPSNMFKLTQRELPIIPPALCF